jgi:hypothetical protein
MHLWNKRRRNKRRNKHSERKRKSKWDAKNEFNLHFFLLIIIIIIFKFLNTWFFLRPVCVNSLISCVCKMFVLFQFSFFSDFKQTSTVLNFLFIILVFCSNIWACMCNQSYYDDRQNHRHHHEYLRIQLGKRFI